MEIKDTIDTSLYRYFSSGSAIKVISNALRDAAVVRIATAYFEPSGYECLREILQGKEVRLLLGREENSADKVRDVVNEFFNALSNTISDERTRSMEELYSALVRGLFQVSVSSDNNTGTTIGPRYLYQHAKLYIADNQYAVVTSSNFTRSGLVASREAGITVSDSDDVEYFAERFDYYYAKAVPVAEELMERLKEWLRVYNPFDIYMRSILELYGMSTETDKGRLPELAAYQRPVVSRIIRNFEEYGGSMLVASTGLGKTIMAAHVVAYLRMQGIIDSAIILCPAGLKTMWQRTMRAARLSSMQFSYYILSVEDWKKYKEIGILEHELKQADEKTVVILDESHHLRNAGGKDDLRIRNRRIIESVKRSAHVLLMTATPYSRKVDDINDQLMLLPHVIKEDGLLPLQEKRPWRIESPGELSALPPGVVLTAPSVVKYFSSDDGKGNRYVLFSGNQKRYFPNKMHIRNIPYENPLDDLLCELLKSGLLNRKSNYSTEDELFLFDEVSSGIRNPLFESHIVHQFCSSLKEADLLLEKMQSEEGFATLRFADQRGLSEFVHDIRCDIAPVVDTASNSCKDSKIKILLKILQDFTKNKVVIFCHYRETAKYVAECITRYMKRKTAETTVDKSPDDIEKIIRRFAPKANTIDIELEEDEYENNTEEIDILVATGKLSEGFNFQDAPVLINFDLPWTVLVLAQRMGRILRPWQEPREVYIFNLMPSTMENEKIHHALNWKNRLHSRNREFSSFSEIPVILDKGSEFEMIDLARSMSSFGDVDLDLDQVFQFIENSDKLSTSSFIDDLAMLSNEEKERLKQLPEGIRSIKKAHIRNLNLYLLFRYRDHLYPVIFDTNGGIIMDNDKMDDIMTIIRSDKNEDPYFYYNESLNVDQWINSSRNAWAVSRKIIPDDISVLCQMVLVPGK